ncbi:putative heterokaryon incompatibility protein [Xylariaceae sp. AK1471]|nr:putative heterokaryon incompatibility protein [Xylariaceae sp. AK1471]
MPPEPWHNEAPNQMAAGLMALPARVRTMIVVLYLGFKASLFALRDTVLSKVFSWTLSNIGLFGYYIPAPIVFIIIHVYLFFFRQSSLQATAITLRRLASRDGADDDLIAKLFVDASDLIVYVFMSLLFRNIAAVWDLFLLPLLQFIALVGPMWFIMIDNPIETFNIEVAKIWNITWPRIRTYLQKLGRFITTILRHCLQLFMNIIASTVVYRDRKTATRVETLGAYQYSALRAGEIRLLKLSKFTPWSPVRCELAPLVLKSLVLGGKRFRVSERVYDIVHDRASCLMTRYVWIDSICINQDDDDEKSSQVQLMRNIYGSSYHTVVWLGYAPDANDAIGFLAHLRRRIDFDDPVERASRPLLDLNIENPSWSALTRLINHDYWTRCWVIQEIAASKNVIISYGGELVTWDHFSSLIEIIFNSDPNTVWHISKIYWRSLDPPPMDAGLQIASLGRVRKIVRVERSMGLFDLLIASINFTATDPRDNIYAVQGISTAVDSGAISPDYTSTIERPFLKTAEYLLKQDHPSRTLHLAGIGFYRNPELQTSWVPDWTTKRLAKIYWRDPLESPYRASDTIDEEPDMILGPNGFTLTLKGIMVDHIKELGPRFFGTSENGVPKTVLFPGVLNDYADSRAMVTNGALREPYITGISLTESFWRTLTGDRTPQGTRPAEPAFFEYYQALERFIETLREFSGPDMNLQKRSVSAEEQARLGSAITSHVTDMGRFANVAGPHTRERMFAITKRGYMGMVPPYSEAGDVVFIISGAQVPFLLRHQTDTEDVNESSGGSWQLVGESYFHGMMDGEMMTEGHAEQTIELC